MNEDEKLYNLVFEEVVKALMTMFKEMGFTKIEERPLMKYLQTVSGLLKISQVFPSMLMRGEIRFIDDKTLLHVPTGLLIGEASVKAVKENERETIKGRVNGNEHQ